MAVLVLCLRELKGDRAWERAERSIRTGFWGLNIGLGLMVVLDRFPGGVIQLWDMLSNGYWHARRLTFLMGGIFHTLEWIRIVADMIFLLAGALPIAYGTLKLLFTTKLKEAA